MNIKITEFEKCYSFELAPITQLCGQNVKKKSYVLESLRRYFSTYKYSEIKNKWRDNVLIDDKTVGRKYFSIISVRQINDIIQLIKWSKQSLMMEYVKNLMQKFDWQLHLKTINEEVEKMFQIINKDINRLGDVELTYSMSEVWDMIQKSDVSSTDETDLNDKSNYELVMIFMNLIDRMLEYEPKKTIVMLENIDHMVDSEEYIDILGKAKMIARKYDINFIFSSSLDGYAYCDDELCVGISVFGDVDFQMSEFEKICEFIRENYPYTKDISDEQIQKELARIIQRIGQKDYLYSIEENVICKLINQSLLLYDKLPEEKLPEMAFLKA